jgi:hypothetical protein
LLSLNTDVFEMIVNQLGVKDTVALASTSALVAAQAKMCTSAQDIMAWSKAMTELAFMPASSYWCRAVPFCREHACTFAAAHGNTNMLKHLRSSGFPWECRTASYAAMGGHVDTLRWIHQNGGLNAYTLHELASNAAMSGHIDVLAYIKENDLPWGYMVCAEAIRGGHFECLEYVVNNGAVFDLYHTARAAALAGRLDILKWLRTHNCTWDNSTCIAAAANGDNDMLEYTFENNCPWDSSVPVPEKYASK